MKKTLYILFLSCVISFMTQSCEMDNYDGPDASISGRFLDNSTGDLVQTDIDNGNEIGVYELGWPTEEKQTWHIKTSGEYTNNSVFAASYRIEFEDCNFYPFILDELVVTKGDNTKDFTVTPYIRVLNPSITYDQGTKTVTATFNLEAGAPGVNLNEIRLFAFTDHFVGNFIKFNIESATCLMEAPGDISDIIDVATQYTLSIPIADSPSDFSVTRNYYFRIGALASVAGVGTVRYNYAPYVAINIAP